MCIVKRAFMEHDSCIEALMYHNIVVHYQAQCLYLYSKEIYTYTMRDAPNKELVFSMQLY